MNPIRNITDIKDYKEIKTVFFPDIIEYYNCAGYLVQLKPIEDKIQYLVFNEQTTDIYLN